MLLLSLKEATRLPDEFLFMLLVLPLLFVALLFSLVAVSSFVGVADNDDEQIPGR